MANCNSCNGSCGRSSWTRVGALNSLCRTGCRNPYYTGPCPPAPCTNSCGNIHPHRSCNCHCNAQIIDLNDGCSCDGCNHCDECNQCECSGCDTFRGYGGRRHSHGTDNWAAHAVFTADAPICLSAGDAVDFEVCSTDAHCFTTSYGNILIRRPGLYCAAVTVNIPKNVETDTVMQLELDGQCIAASETAVSTICDGSTSNFAGHAIFRAGSGSLLKLVSRRALSIDCSAAQPVFTLTLFKIC